MRILCVAVALALAIGGCDQRDSDSPRLADRSVVAALGRVTPGRGVISIAAEPGNRLLKVEVADGQKVRAGDVLACLETQMLRAAERDAAKVALDEARARLAAETAYAEAVIEQSREAVRLLEITVDRERKELHRFEELVAKKALPEHQLENQQFLVRTREAELAKANAELRAAQAGLERTRSMVAVKSAEAQLKTAEAQLELTILRAPIDGEILKVFTNPGERIGDGPILKMGATAEMYVVAEVHETDIGAVRVGQRATGTSAALPEPIHGVVEEIGALIDKNDVLDLDPRADQDTRIVEVRIKLDKPEAVARLTHLEVSTRIELGTPAPGATSAAR